MIDEKSLIKEARLAVVHRAIHTHTENIFIRTMMILTISACCLPKSPLKETSILNLDFPAPVFYIIIATTVISSFIFGILGYIRRLPLFDIEEAIESDQITEAELIMRNMERKNKSLEILDNVFLVTAFLFFNLPFFFNYYAECPHCNAEISVNSSVCSECDSEVNFDKDIIEYIMTER